MDYLFDDALEEMESATEGYRRPMLNDDRKSKWEMVTIDVLADLGLSDGQIARYLHASEADVLSLRRNR